MGKTTRLLVYLNIRISVLIDFFFRFPHGTMVGMYFMMKEFADHRFRVASPVFTDGAVMANRSHDSLMDTGFFLRHGFRSFLNRLVSGSIDSSGSGFFTPERFDSVILDSFHPR